MSNTRWTWLTHLTERWQEWFWGTMCGGVLLLLLFSLGSRLVFVDRHGAPMHARSRCSYCGEIFSGQSRLRPDRPAWCGNCSLTYDPASQSFHRDTGDVDKTRSGRAGFGKRWQ